MLIKCPNCGAGNSLATLINQDDATKAVLSALKLSTTGALLIEYLTLFRPKKSYLTMKRVAKLLNEVQPLVANQRLVFDGVVYDVPIAVWDIALEKMIQQRDAGKLQTPLENHNYLFRVIVTECSRDASRDAINRVSTIPLSPDVMNRDAMNRDAMNRDAMNRDAMNRDAMNRDAMNRDAMNRVSTKPLSATMQAVLDLEKMKGDSYVAG